MWQNKLKDDILVLDGGLASELESNGDILQGHALWSASTLYEKPNAIFNVHTSYLASGADVIITASYQASIPGFQRHLGLKEDEAKELIRRSVTVARDARDKFGGISKGGKAILIAGSVGPYGAWLADGSEYTGDYCDHMTHEELIQWHRPRVECLLEAGVDLLAFETIPALKEAEALMELLSEFSAKAWLSFSCQSMHQNVHSEDIGSCALKCAKMSSPSQLIAVGVNCCPPECVLSLLGDIHASVPDYPLVAYPNSGEKWSKSRRWHGDREPFPSSQLKSWANCSAKIIGGCCRTTPEDVCNIFRFVQELYEE